MNKEELQKRLDRVEKTYYYSMIIYLTSGKKFDRDRALQLKGKVELLKELIKDFK